MITRQTLIAAPWFSLIVGSPYVDVQAPGVGRDGYGIGRWLTSRRWRKKVVLDASRSGVSLKCRRLGEVARVGADGDESTMEVVPVQTRQARIVPVDVFTAALWFLSGAPPEPEVMTASASVCFRALAVRALLKAPRGSAPRPPPGQGVLPERWRMGLPRHATHFLVVVSLEPEALEAALQEG